MGFRLFDNPDFTGDAVKQWDAEKYYSDPQYATKKGLIRPIASAYRAVPAHRVSSLQSARRCQ